MAEAAPNANDINAPDETYPNRDPCFSCKGSGQDPTSPHRVCHQCRGNGLVPRSKTHRVLLARNRRILGRAPADQMDWPQYLPVSNPRPWAPMPREMRESVIRLSGHFERALRRDAEKYRVRTKTVWLPYFTKKKRCVFLPQI